MSTSYMLTPPAPTSWRVELDAFAASLSRRWPAAEVWRGDSASDAVAWSLAETDERWLEGRIHEDGTFVNLEGDVDLVVDAVRWFRAEHPEPDLVFIDEADGTEHPVLATSSHDELRAMAMGPGYDEP